MFIYFDFVCRNFWIMHLMTFTKHCTPLFDASVIIRSTMKRLIRFQLSIYKTITTTLQQRLKPLQKLKNPLPFLYPFATVIMSNGNALQRTVVYYDIKHLRLYFVFFTMMYRFCVARWKGLEQTKMDWLVLW